MKKIFTLLLAAGSIFSAAAQYNGNASGFYAQRGSDRNLHNNDHDYYGTGKEKGSYGNPPFSLREKELALQKTNLWYDQQIAAVNRKRYLSNRERKQHIRSLEMQRMDAIRDIRFRFDQQAKRSIPDNHSRKW